MNTLRTIITLTIFSFATAAFSQHNASLFFKLDKIDDNTYGVFVQPDTGISPTTGTTTGSGQVTLVAPIDFDYENLVSVSGTWVENARVDAPEEAFDNSYISFGFVADMPKLNLFPNEETLLFTFETVEGFNGAFSLFENENDVFAVPNSYNSNPGNDLGVIDHGTGQGLLFYTYAGNIGTEQNPQVILASKNEE